MGEGTGDTVSCPSCKGNVQLKTFKCSVHGTTTLTRRAPGVGGCCETCPDHSGRTAPPSRDTQGFPPSPTARYQGDHGPVGKRHLVYHVLPVSGNGVWQRGVRNLALRWGLFTGRKVVSVATGPGLVPERVDPSEKVGPTNRKFPLAPVSEVRSLLPADAEVVEVPNDPNLWELTSWNGLWGALLSEPGVGDDDAVLYAHAKGVTRKLMSPCHTWTDMLYSLALDHWPLVERAMSSVPLVGSLLKPGRFFGGLLIGSAWHYSGGFWWGRVGALRDRIPAYPLPLNAWATEAWTGAAFHPGDAGVVFTPRVPISHLYHPHELEKVVGEYVGWLRRNPPSIVPPTTTTVMRCLVTAPAHSSSQRD